MLTIFDTIYVNCPEDQMTKILRKGIKGEVLVGAEFVNTKPTRSSIKISSARTTFGKYKDWYFHVNCEDPEFRVYDFANPVVTLDDHIRMVKRRNTSEVLKYINNPWLSIPGIGPVLSQQLDPDDFHFWPDVQKKSKPSRKTAASMLGSVVPEFTIVDLTTCKYIDPIPVSDILPVSYLENTIS